jgi:hypothetical protein
MQNLNDDELQALLQQWRVPEAPPALEDRLVAAAGFSSLRRLLQWLFTGTIRVPAPVGIGLAAVLLWLAFQLARPAPSFDGFQPVRELKPRIIRSSHESN